MIRTQPNSKSLCTIEAIALSLSLLEDNDEIAEVRVFMVQETLLAVNGGAVALCLGRSFMV